MVSPSTFLLVAGTSETDAKSAVAYSNIICLFICLQIFMGTVLLYNDFLRSK